MAAYFDLHGTATGNHVTGDSIHGRVRLRSLSPVRSLQNPEIRGPRPDCMQRCGVDEISAAFDAGEEISLLLVLRDSEAPDVARLRAIAEERGIPVREVSSSDLWRMARDNRDETPEVLALVGRDPGASLEEVLERGGLVWMLAGALYPAVMELLEIRYLWKASVIIDDARRRQLLPDFRATPIDAAIEATVESYRAEEVNLRP